MRIIKGDISPAAVPRLTPEEMLPTQERDAQREIEAKAYELSRLDHVDPFLKEALMGSSGDFAAAGGAGGGKEEGGGIGAEGEEGTKEGEDEKKGESGGATSPPLAVAGGESGEVFTCERCGSKNIGHVHRNALEDEQERMLECSCNSCGAVWVVED